MTDAESAVRDGSTINPSSAASDFSLDAMGAQRAVGISTVNGQ